MVVVVVVVVVVDMYIALHSTLKYVGSGTTEQREKAKAQDDNKTVTSITRWCGRADDVGGRQTENTKKTEVQLTHFR